MSTITSEILAKVAPLTKSNLRDRFLPYFNECLPRYHIINKDEVAAFLTTVCFESDYFKALAEYADGWVYDISRNRKKALELGNTQVGDGPKYKGAGGIETTGKKNYQRLSDRLGVDFVANPNLLRTEKYFVEAACVFWDDNHFNELADNEEITRIENITNRGSGNKTAKALATRLKIYANVMSVLPDDFSLETQLALSNQDTPRKVDVQKPDIQSPTGNESPENIKTGAQTADTILNKVDKAGDKWTALTAILGKFGISNPNAARSKGTLILTAVKYAGSAVLTIATFITNNWIYLVFAALLIILAVYIWDRSGQRVADAKAGVPTDILKDTNVLKDIK